MKFVCVKARPLYDAPHVNRILAMLKLHSTVPVTLTCLTDDEFGIDPEVEIVKLKHDNLSGWWHKLQIFEWSQTQSEPICYIDLDTIITGNIDPLASYTGQFACLRDFYRGGTNYGSGVMLIQGGFGKELAEPFFKDPEKYMKAHAPGPGKAGKWGDQAFIEDTYKGADFLQDLFPGMVISFKLDVAERGAVPHGASIICYHGLPRPFHYAGALPEGWRVLK